MDKSYLLELLKSEGRIPPIILNATNEEAEYYTESHNRKEVAELIQQINEMCAANEKEIYGLTKEKKLKLIEAASETENPKIIKHVIEYLKEVHSYFHDKKNKSKYEDHKIYENALCILKANGQAQAASAVKYALMMLCNDEKKYNVSQKRYLEACSTIKKITKIRTGTREYKNLNELFSKSYSHFRPIIEPGLVEFCINVKNKSDVKNIIWLHNYITTEHISTYRLSEQKAISILRSIYTAKEEVKDFLFEAISHEKGEKIARLKKDNSKVTLTQIIKYISKSNNVETAKKLLDLACDISEKQGACFSLSKIEAVEKYKIQLIKSYKEILKAESKEVEDLIYHVTKWGIKCIEVNAPVDEHIGELVKCIKNAKTLTPRKVKVIESILNYYDKDRFLVILNLVKLIIDAKTDGQVNEIEAEVQAIVNHKDAIFDIVEKILQADTDTYTDIYNNKKERSEIAHMSVKYLFHNKYMNFENTTEIIEKALKTKDIDKIGCAYIVSDLNIPVTEEEKKDIVNIILNAKEPENAKVATAYAIKWCNGNKNNYEGLLRIMSRLANPETEDNIITLTPTEEQIIEDSGIAFTMKEHDTWPNCGYGHYNVPQKLWDINLASYFKGKIPYDFEEIFEYGYKRQNPELQRIAVEALDEGIDTTEINRGKIRVLLREQPKIRK